MKKLYYLKISNRSKIIGSSLLSTMIFAFVLLIIVSSLVYIFRYNLLSMNSLLGSDTSTKIEEQYLNKIKASKKVYVGNQKIGDYKFENKVISKEALFSNKLENISLYDASPVAIAKKIDHSVYYQDKLNSNKSLFFKKLPKHRMIDYDSKYLPINVPYVAQKRMNGQERLYHLKNGSILDKQVGYIGFIEKDYNWLLLHVNNTSRIINLAHLELDNNSYQVSLGWHLYHGRWQLLVAVYDENHIYIYKTMLEKLKNHMDEAVLDLSSPIAEISTVSGIKNLAWYFPGNNSTPSLLVTVPSHDSEDNLSVKLYSIDYDKDKNTYIVDTKDTLNGIGKYGYDTVHIQSLDSNYTLAKSSLVVSAGKRLIVYQTNQDSDSVSKFYMKLEDTSMGVPLIIKKDKYNYYVITYNKDSYYQYVYTKDTDILSKVQPKTYENEKIRSIETAYGYKFIITKNNVYVEDFLGNQLNKLKI